MITYVLTLVCMGNLSFAQDNKLSETTFEIGVKPEVRIDYNVVLSSAMNEALKKWNPDFRICKRVNYAPEIIREYKYTYFRSPSAVFGDFNRDNIIDVVLTGYTNKIEMVAIVSNSPKPDLRNSENMQYDHVVNPYTLSSFSREREAIIGGYKVIEIWMSGVIEPAESPRDIKVVLTFHPKGEVIKSNSEYPDACNEVLKNDAFGVKNFDFDGVETLFPCEEYISPSCVMRK